MAAGDTVKTGADGRVGLFFSDGSQVMLEPDTEIALAAGDGIALTLAGGQLWAAANTAAISVDAGGPVAAGTAVGFDVAKEGEKVTVSSVGGNTTFTAGGSSATVAAGQVSVSEGNGAPSAPAAIEVKNALRIVVEGEALLYLADPSGRAVGYHPTREYMVSQIPDGWYSGEKSRPQTITVPNPEPGEYTILLVAAGNQAGWKMAVGTAGADLVYTERKDSSTITWGTPTGITLKISIGADGTPVVDEMSAIWTLYTDPPGKAAVSDDLKRLKISFGETVPAWANQ
ncbi:FecR domain-containing protein [bacterium]|nr:MAG: FecR domain-containing protein [bacterium]